MISIPIGEYFELLVRWLKDSFTGFFDGISVVLNFSIQLVENSLLLEADGLYPSIIFGAVLAVCAGLLGSRMVKKKWFLPIFLGVAIVFGAAEYWRVKELSAEITPEMASVMAGEFTALKSSLEKQAPENFDEAKGLLKRAMNEIPENDNRESPEYEARDTIEDGIRDIDRARSGEYDEVFEAIESANESLVATSVDLPGSLTEELLEQEVRFESLILIEESERLIDDLKEISSPEDAEARNDFINNRTYSELRGLLAVTESFYSEAGEDGIVAEANAANDSLRMLNPDRLTWFAPIALIVLLAIIALLIAGGGVALFTVIGFIFIISMDLWIPTVESLALVLCATLFALLLGVPAGIFAARSKTADGIIRPILDFMQTMPAFVYLIPAVIFFGLGKVPGAIATLVFAMPPAVRLTSLGIRQVPEEVVEAAQAFGSTGRQMLFKAQLPIAMPTILAGVNQTIMLALSMVVIGGMIGAGGLGEVVLSGITQLKLGLGFEGGLAVVILAIYLDRVTQALGTPKT